MVNYSQTFTIDPSIEIENFWGWTLVDNIVLLALLKLFAAVILIFTRRFLFWRVRDGVVFRLVERDGWFGDLLLAGES